MKRVKLTKTIIKRMLVMILAVATFMTSLPVDSLGVIAYAAENEGEIEQISIQEVDENAEEPAEESPVIWDGVTTTKPVKGEDGYYQITSGEQLAWFVEFVNYTNPAARARLVNDIYLNDVSDWTYDSTGHMYKTSGTPNTWTPIGTSDSRFKGDFDGNGKTVYGLYSNNTKDSSCGLFGYVDGGKIHDVNLSKGVFNTCANGIGTVVSNAENAKISGCTSDVSIYYNTTVNDYRDNNNYRGGIVGQAVSSDITGCCFSGYIDGCESIGGIAGTTSNGTVISECRMTGYLSGYKGGYITGTQMSASDIISECAVDIDGSYGRYVEGITYALHGQVYDCYINISNFTRKSSDYVYALAENIYGNAKVRRVVFANNSSDNRIQDWLFSYNDSSSDISKADIADCYTVKSFNYIESKEADELKNICYIADMSDGITAYKLQKATGRDTAVWSQLLKANDDIPADNTPVLARIKSESKPVVKTDLIWKSKDSVVCVYYNNAGDKVTIDDCDYKGLVTILDWVDEDGKAVESFTAGVKDTYYVDENKISTEDGIKFKGEGSKSKPYIITNADQLKVIAAQVNAGNPEFVSAYYELGNDITLDSTYVPIGKDASYPFKGRFDGKGHKITGLAINFEATSSNAYYGLFGYVIGATIKNFNVSGTITATGNGSGAYVGAVVAYAKEGSLISDITSGVSITYNSNKSNVGGIAGYLYKSVMTRCINDKGISEGGALVGTTDAASLITACIARGENPNQYSPLVYNLSSGSKLCNSVNESSYNADIKINGLKNTGDGKIVNCYVSEAYSDGVELASGNVAGKLNMNWVSNDCDNEDSVFCQLLTGEARDAYPLLAGECKDRVDNSIVYGAEFVSKKKLVDATYSNIGTVVTAPALSVDANYTSTAWVSGQSVLKPGDTFELTGNIIYKENLSAKGITKPEGEGTEESPYLIDEANELRWLSLNIEVGNESSLEYADAYYKLTHDITLNNTGEETNILSIGTEDTPFTGTFDGNGHKISGIYIREELDKDGDTGAAALFAYVGEGATIRNLITAGDIYTNGKYAAGLVSHVAADNGILIEKCTSYVNITCTAQIQIECGFGGIVGRIDRGSANYADKISSCCYAGKMSASENSPLLKNVGGILGSAYNYNYAKINNCLSLAEYAENTLDDSNYPIVNSSSSSINQNNYYLNSPRSNEVNSNYGYKCTDEEIKSGKVTYKLQSESDANTWGQKLSGDTPDMTPYIEYNADDSKYVKKVVVKGLEETAYYVNPEQTIDIALTRPEDVNGIRFVGWVAGDTTYDMENTSISYTASQNKEDEVISLVYDLNLNKNEEGAYEIASVSDLNTLAAVVNNTTYKYLTKNRKFVLTEDIKFTKEESDEYIPIGKDGRNKAENITFDGQNHMISGLNFTGSSYSYVGLFGYASDCNISNLVLTGSISNLPGYSNAGILGGHLYRTNVSNCIISGDIEVTTTKGGYVGVMAGRTQYYTVKDCYISGEIAAKSGSMTNSIGGIVGYYDDFSLSDSISTVKITVEDGATSHIGVIAGEKFLTPTCKNVSVLRDDTVNKNIADIYADSSTYANNITLDSLKSGSECYRLNVKYGKSIFGQKLTGDDANDRPVVGKTDYPVYKITYVTGINKRTEVYVNAGEYTIDNSLFTESGYELEGWYDNEECAGEPLAAAISITTNKTIYAKKVKAGDGWKNIIYKNGIVVDADGNTVTEGIPAELSQGTAISELSGSQFLAGNAVSLVKRPSHVEGYVFQGWYSDEKCTTSIDSISEDVKEDVTVYAKWKVYSGWDGTSAIEPKKAADGTYEIYLADELNWFGQQVNGGDNAISARLMKDIDLNPGAEWTKDESKKIYTVTGADKKWTPIGSSTKPFKGEFDGNNHKITGLYVTATSDYSGLFAYTDGALIKNLTLDKGIVYSTFNYAGAVAGYAKNSTITNCISDVSVYSSTRVDSYQFNSNYFGGIAGYIDSSSVTECEVNAYIDCYAYAGGIAGYVKGSSKIEKSYADIHIYGDDYMGGIAGYIEASASIISKSGAAGYIKGFRSGGIAAYIDKNVCVDMCEVDLEYIYGSRYSGVFAGKLYGTLTNSYARVASVGYTYVSGLADTLSADAVVKNCITTGEFNNGYTYINTTNNNNNIRNCYYTKNLSNPYNGGSLGEDSTVSYVPDMSDGLAAYNLQSTIESDEAVWGQRLTGDNADLTPVLVYHHPDAPVVAVVSVIDKATGEQVESVVGNIGQEVTLKEINKDNGMYVYDTYTDAEGNKIDSVTVDGSNTQKIYALLAESSLIKSGEYDDNIEGEGTKEAPYKISSDKVLRYIRHMMTVDAAYMSAHYELTADIDLGESEKANFESIGTWQLPFTGTFDGKGYGISNLNIEKDGDYTALFAYTGAGAKISNLSVHGKVTAHGRYAGSIVGYASSSITIDNCHSDIDITTDGSSDAGGIIACANVSNNYINNCSFTGSIKSTSNSAVNNYGGIIGYANGTTYLNNCYTDFAGNGVTISDSCFAIAGTDISYVNSTNCYTTDRSGWKLLNNSSNDQKCVSKEAVSSGELAYGIMSGSDDSIWTQQVGSDTKPVTVMDSSQSVPVYRALYVINDAVISTVYGNAGKEYTIPDYPESLEAVVTASGWMDVDTEVTSVPGDSKLLNKDVIYKLVYSNAEGYEACAGEGTAEKPYKIGNADNLYWAIRMSNMFPEFASAYYVLTNDITTDKPISSWGTKEIPFAGQINGYGHTISGINITEGNALFAYAKPAAVIKNLKLKGKIRSEAGYLSGLVGYVIGASGDTNRLTIDNCISDIDIVSTHTENDGVYIGGLVAYAENSYAGLMIKNSAYVGTISSENISVTDVGGLVGYCSSSSNQSIENSFIDAVFGDNISGNSICTKTVTVNNVFSTGKHSDDEKNKLTILSKESAASGELAYKMNQAVGARVWGQELGSDNYPVYYADFDGDGEADVTTAPVHKVIYSFLGKKDDIVTYANDTVTLISEQEAVKLLLTGYSLVGLKADMSSDVTLAYGDSIPVTDDMTIYVVGQKAGNDWHSITYYVDGDEADFLELTSYNEAKVEELPTVNKKNCTFTGWYTTKDCKGEPIFNTNGCTTDLVLYAGFVELATGAETTFTAGGAGTEVDPYIITNANQLLTISELIESDKANDAGLKYSEAYYKQSGNIYFNSIMDWSKDDNYGTWSVDSNKITYKSIQQIGRSSSKPFKGSYDGDGYTIYGLYHNNDTQAGIFGYINGATIANVNVGAGYVCNPYSSSSGFGLVVDNAYNNSTIINCTNKATIHTGRGYMGGIVGYAENSTIEECTNKGNIYNSYNSGGDSAIAGGIAGRITATKVKDCTNDAKIYANYSAGLVSYAGTADNDTALVSGCINYGTAYDYNRVINTINDAFANYNYGTIIDCINVQDSSNVLIYRNNAKLYNCYTQGNTILEYPIHQYTSSSYTKEENIVYDKSMVSSTVSMNSQMKNIEAVVPASGQGTYLLNKNRVRIDENDTDIHYYQSLAGDEVHERPMLAREITDADLKKEVISASFSCLYANTIYMYINKGVQFTVPDYPDNMLYTVSGWKNMADDTEVLSAGNSIALENDTEYMAEVAIADSLTAPSGSGTAEDPYMITDANELRWVSAAIKLNNDASAEYAAAYYELSEDIVLPDVSEGESNILPIGTKENPFSGEFKGNGHTISGLAISETLDSDGGEGHAALFGYIGGAAYIHDFKIAGNVQTNGKYAAGVVSHISESATSSAKIMRIMSDVDIHSTAAAPSGKDYTAYFGGIVGVSECAQYSYIKIWHCGYTGNISGNENVAVKGVAGIMAYQVNTYTVDINSNLSAATYDNVTSGYYITDTSSIRNNNNGALVNNDALKTTCVKYSLTEEDLTSGKAAYNFYNSSNISYGLVWGQNLGAAGASVDKMPVLMYETYDEAAKNAMRVNKVSVNKPDDSEYSAYYLNKDQRITVALPELEDVPGVIHESWTMDENTYSLDTKSFEYVLTSLGDKKCTEVYSLDLSQNENGEYEIDSAEDMRILADLKSHECYYTLPDSKKYVLTADIAYDRNTEDNYKPIGGFHKLSGITFDGQNHMITGLHMTGTTNYLGLFGSICNSTVKNLMVEGKINENYAGRANLYAGLLSGNTEQSNYDNCIVMADIAVDDNISNAFIGAAFGRAYSLGTVNNLYVTGNIDIVRDYSAYYHYIGGIMGAIEGNTSVKISALSSVAITGENAKYKGVVAGYCSTSINSSSAINILQDEEFNSGYKTYGDDSSSLVPEVSTISAYESGAITHRCNNQFKRAVLGQMLTGTIDRRPVLVNDANHVFSINMMKNDDVIETRYSNLGEYTLPDNYVVDAGYTYVGWSTDNTSDNLITSLDMDSDKVVYLIQSKNTSDSNWKNINYINGKVVQVTDDVESDYESDLITVGSTVAGYENMQYYEGIVTKLTNPAYVEDYVFEGWYTDEACTEENKIESISADITGELKVYAKWKYYPYWDGKSISEPACDKDGVYLIYNPDELAWLANTVNNGAVTTDMSVRLMADIKLNDTSEWTYNDAKYSYSISDEVAAKMNNWIPIGGYGDKNKTFGGEFDGNGHNIEGLYIDSSHIKRYSGLFGCLEGANIHDLNISHSYINSYNYHYTAILAAHINNSLVLNCNIEGTNTGYKNQTTKGYNLFSGGIIGCAKNSTVKECVFTGYVSLDSYSGQIVGNTSGGTIDTCQTNGTIECLGSINYIGTITGYLSDNATIVNCENNVTASNCGGFAGKTYEGTVRNCVNNSTVGYGFAYEAGKTKFENCVWNKDKSSGSICCENNNAQFINSYCGLITGTVPEGVIKMSLADGKAAYMLQKSVSAEEGLVFAQNLSGDNIDKYPRIAYFNKDSKPVHVISILMDGTTIETMYANEGDVLQLPEYSSDSISITGLKKSGEEDIYDSKFVAVGAEDIVFELLYSTEEDISACEGTGTAFDPYIITNEENLRWAAVMMGMSDSMNTACFELTNDITLSDRKTADSANFVGFGTSDKPFDGTFNGKGHSIKNIQVSENLNETEASDSATALFRYVGTKAVIKNLITDGSIITNGKYASGLIAHIVTTQSKSIITIDGCISNVSITGSYNGSTTGYYAGLLANRQSDGSIYINECAYRGKVTFSDDANLKFGGFIGTMGSVSSSANTIEYSYCSAEYNSAVTGDNVVADKLSNQYISTNQLYYLNGLSTSNYGTAATIDKFTGGYIAYTYQNNNSSTRWSQTMGVDDVPELVYGGLGATDKIYKVSFTYGNDYSATDYYGNAEMTLDIVAPNYPTQITGPVIFNGWNYGSNVYKNGSDMQITVQDSDMNITLNADLNMEKDSSDRYMITSLTDWNNLASLVNSSYTNTYTTNKKYVLTTDIKLDSSISNNINIMGMSYDNMFNADFDGAGHVIEGINISASSKYVGLFGKVSTGNICNITVDGIITVSPKEFVYAGGIVGDIGNSSVKSNINNVTSYVDIILESYVPNRKTAIGGIIGYGNNTDITDCNYAGVIDMNNSNSKSVYAGGLAGYYSAGRSLPDIIKNNIVQGKLHNVGGGSDYSGILVGYFSLWSDSKMSVSNCSVVQDEGYNDNLPMIEYTDDYTMPDDVVKTVTLADLTSGKFAYDMNSELINAGSEPVWTIKDNTYTGYEEYRASRYTVKDETAPLIYSVTYLDNDGKDITADIIAGGDIGYIHAGNGNVLTKEPLGCKWRYEDGTEYKITDVIAGDITVKAVKDELKAVEDTTITVAQGVEYSIDVSEYVANEEVFDGIASCKVKDGSSLLEGLSLNETSGIIEGTVGDSAVDSSVTIIVTSVEGSILELNLSFVVKQKRQGLQITGIPEAGSKNLEYGQTFTVALADAEGNAIPDSSAVTYKIVKGNEYAVIPSEHVGTVNVTGVGNVELKVTLAGDETYAPTSVTKTFDTARTDAPSLNVISNVVKDEDGNYTATYGDSDIRLYEDSTKPVYGDGKLSVSVDSESATYNESTGSISFLKAGTITLTVTKAASANYNEKSTELTFVIAKAKQNQITVSSSITGKDEDNNYLLTYGQNAKLSITGGSGNGDVIYYVTDAEGNETDVASVDNTGAIIINKTGSFKAYAVKSTDSCYEEKRSQNTLTFLVSRANEPGAQMVVPEGMISKKGAYQTAEGEKFTLSVKGLLGSGKVTYSSSDTSIATVDSTTGVVDVIGVGDFVITAAKAECDRYNAIEVKANFHSLLPSQADLVCTVTYGENKTAEDIDGVLTLPYNTQSAKLSITGGSGDGAVSYEITSGDDEAAIATDGTITGLKTGSYEITVTKENSSSYEDKIQKFTIRVKAQSQAALNLIPDESKVTVDDDGVWHVVYGDGTFVMTATGGSGNGEVRYISGDKSIMTVNASTGLVTILKPGTCTIYAYKEGVSGVYEPEYTEKVTIVVEKAKQTDVTLQRLQKTEDSKYIIELGYSEYLTAGNVKENASVTYKSSDTKVVDIYSRGKVYSTGLGSCKITVTVDETDYYAAATFEYDVVVRRASVAVPSISVQPQSAEYKTGDSITPLTITASTTDEGTLSYQWYVSDTNEAAGTAIEGATANSYTPEVAEGNTKYYYCIVTNTYDEVISSTKTQEITSEIAKIRVKKKYAEGEAGKIIVNEATIWDRLLNTITFGQYELPEPSVEIESNIENGKIEYIVITDGKTEVMTDEELDAVTTWKEYDGKFELESEKSVVYAKLTDNVEGYVYYICTDGITIEPSATPSPSPTATPTVAPSATPTVAPTATPTVAPSATPTATVAPSATPTATVAPSATPTATAEPSATPTATVEPSATPTATVAPSATPTASPTATVAPSATPTATVAPSATPTATVAPSATPTATAEPSATPTATVAPSATPTASPTATAEPSATPTATAEPSATPTATVAPTEKPTSSPTATVTPTSKPTAKPSEKPTAKPSEKPTAKPSEAPTAGPSEAPTAGPSVLPTAEPTEEPVVEPDGVIIYDTDDDESDTKLSKPGKVKLIHIIVGKKKVTIKWKKKSGVSGYMVKYSSKKNMKGAKTVVIRGAKKSTLTIKKLKSRKKYYIKLCAYKKSGDRFVNGKWSVARRVTVK